MESMTDQEHLIKIKESNMVQVIDPLCQSTNAESKEITSDVQWLIEQAEKTERYENILHFIANIDTIFYLPDGTEREWDDKEALKEIEKSSYAYLE